MMFLPSKSHRIVSLAAAAALLAGVSAAPAGTSTQPQPSGAETGHRLAMRGHRISHEVGKGTIARTEARKLHKHHGMVRKAGRLMASKHGSQMIKTEGRSSNQKGNEISGATGK
jgi:hypothetical protein